MTPQEKAAYDEAAGGLRGHAPAPMIAWLKNPEFARRAQKLGEYLRYQTSLPPRLSELAILITARYWTSHYEWQAHKQEALKAGLDPEVIASIASRRPPRFASDAEAAIYELATTLFQTGLIPDELYRRGIGILGEKAVVELVGILGYYTLVSMTLNMFEINLPDAIQPELLNAGGK
jgi:4-carboxymuconolactone decarboxylase